MSNVQRERVRHYAVVESTFGTIPAVAGTDWVKHIQASMRRSQEYLVPEHVLGYRTQPPAVPGGNVQGEFRFRGYVIPSGTGTTRPQAFPFFKSAFGEENGPLTSVTVAATPVPTATVFTVTGTITGLRAGMMVSVGNEIRPIDSVAGQVITLKIALPAAPAAATAVFGINYAPKSYPPVSLSLLRYHLASEATWAQATSLFLAQASAGGVINDLRLNLGARLYEFEASGLAQDIKDSTGGVGDPAWSTVIQNEPATPSSLGSPLSRAFGSVYLDVPTVGTFVASKILDFAFRLGNQAELQDRPIGSQLADGVSLDRRIVQLDLTVYLTEALQALYKDAKARTVHGVFIQLGNTSQKLAGLWLPNAVFDLPEFDEGRRELQLRYNNVTVFGSAGDDEAFFAFG